MTPNPPPAAELLAAHASSLRALARHLVGDPHAAEDAVQDTWLRALERPPARLDALGGWLRTVLRHVVANRRRDEARRSSREAVAARPEAQAAPGHPQARALRSVVDAVLGLDEPYQRTVLARFFEDLPPREIARREGVSIHTVESRLQRALALLRGRLSSELEDEVGGARHALVLLAGLRPEGAAPAGAALAAGVTTAAGALVVGTKTKVALAGSAAALVAWLAWMAWPEPAAPVEVAAPDVPQVARRTPVEPQEQPTPAEAVVVEPSATEQVPVPLPPSQHIELDVLVRTHEGLPLRGAAVLAAPDRHALNDVATTGPHGQARVRIGVLAPRLDLVVAAWHPAHGLAGPWRFEASRRGENRVVLTLDPSALPPLEAQVAAERRSPLDELRGNVTGASERLVPVLLAPLALRDDEVVRLVGARAVPLCRSWIYSTSSAGPPERESDWADGDLVLDWNRVLAAAAEASAAFSWSTREPLTHGARLVGNVLGPDGIPVAGALVAVGSELSPLAWQARTDELGAYVVEGLPAGRLHIIALGAGIGRAESEPTATLGQSLVWDALLDTGHCYAGTLRLMGGPQPERLRVEWAAADRGVLETQSTDTDRDGAFVLPCLPRERAVLFASLPGWRLPLAVHEKLKPGPRAREHRLSGDDLETGELSLRVVPPAVDAPTGDLRVTFARALLAGVEARVWTSRKRPAERGTWMERGEAVGEFCLAGLPPGRYQVEVGSAELGWVEVDGVELEPGQTLDLGRLHLEQGAQLSVERSAGAERTLWLVRRDEVEAVLHQLDPGDGRRLRLAPGSYLLVDAGDRSRGFAFTLQAGETLLVSDEGVLSRRSPR